MSKRKTLLSIHDVWPETLSDVEELIALIHTHHSEAPIGLLVSVDFNWTGDALDHLKKIARKPNLYLAGHGGTHTAHDNRTLYHHVHGAVLSRNAAEHLSRPAEELKDLVLYCYTWFEENSFEPPTLYVPPAWAMGALTRKDLDVLPFRYYETLSGIYDSKTKTFHYLSLKGYEADTAWRAFTLRTSNGVNQNLPFPLRMAIHPHDHHLKLAAELDADIQSADSFSTPDDLTEKV